MPSIENGDTLVANRTVSVERVDSFRQTNNNSDSDSSMLYPFFVLHILTAMFFVKHHFVQALSRAVLFYLFDSPFSFSI